VVQISPSPRSAEKVDARKAEILRLAADAFRERGYHGASMKDIAAALGTTAGSLYYYFHGKDDLLYFCQRHALDLLLEGARRAAAAGGTAAERVRALVRSHVLCLLDATGGSAANLEFRSLEPKARAEIAARRDAYERIVRAAIARGVKAGELRRVDPKLATLAILGAVNGTVVWYRPDGPKTPAEIADAFADSLVGGLCR
jgi:AcrR family transcriptional regulator